jgi:hypothetical protein
MKKNFLLLLFAFIGVSCGVKGKPLAPNQPAWIGRGELSLSEQIKPSSPTTTQIK